MQKSFFFSSPAAILNSGKFFAKLTFIFSLSFATMSFKTGNLTNHSNNITGDKDSAKNFRNLLGNGMTADGSKILFDLNSKVIPFVDAYLLKQSGNLTKMKEWGQPYFMIYERVLAIHSMPLELKYLSVIESNLQAGAISVAGAAGPWQLMPAEARRFGLKVTAAYDERTNFYKSTEVAAKLLKELYREYNDWLLVIAAYNCGKGGLNRAITKARSRSFYDLQMYLPEETRNHVKKYIATHYFFEGGGGWTTLTLKETTDKKEALAYLQSKADTTEMANNPGFDITGKYNSVVLANTVNMNINEFNKLNPYFDKTMLEGKTYTLRLPQDKMDIFKNKRQQVIYESVQLFLSGNTQQASTATAIK